MNPVHLNNSCLHISVVSKCVNCEMMQWYIVNNSVSNPLLNFFFLFSNGFKSFLLLISHWKVLEIYSEPDATLHYTTEIKKCN